MHPSKLPEQLLMLFIALPVPFIIEPGHQVILNVHYEERRNADPSFDKWERFDYSRDGTVFEHF